LPWEITFSTFCSAYSSEKHVACIQWNIKYCHV
jgi:hypothetical protein